MYCFNCMSEIEDGSLRCPQCGSSFDLGAGNQRALRPGTVLNGKYMLGKVLGEGGFGITYLGLDMNLKLKVAIKEYFPVQCATRNISEGGSNNITVVTGQMEKIFKKGYDDYEREARRLAALEHLPGIVHVMNFFYENNTAYMVMEFVQGTTLKDYLKEHNNRIGWKETLDLMKPIIESLKTVHRNSIIHRDISPDNIMMGTNGKIVLIDFGSARETDNEKSMTVALKHGYAPPEQYQTRGNQGPWTDVYAMCATMYRMMTGKLLPDGMAIYTGAEKIIMPHEFDKTLPVEIENAVIKGLNPRLDDRIKSMDELYGYLYEGKKIIPWKKIITVSVAVLAVILLIVGIKGVIGLAGAANQKSEEVAIETYNKEVVSEEENNEKAKKKQSVDVEKSGDTAQDYVSKHNLEYTMDSLISVTDNEDGVTVTNTDYTVSDVVIPSKVNGKDVTEINGIGSNVTSLVLPDTLRRIDANAFKNCVYLESIYIPAQVSSIGDAAFENTASLTEIIIAEGNEYFSLKDGKITDKDGKTYN